MLKTMSQTGIMVFWMLLSSLKSWIFYNSLSQVIVIVKQVMVQEHWHWIPLTTHKQPVDELVRLKQQEPHDPCLLPADLLPCPRCCSHLYNLSPRCSFVSLDRSVVPPSPSIQPHKCRASTHFLSPYPHLVSLNPYGIACVCLHFKSLASLTVSL